MSSVTILCCSPFLSIDNDGSGFVHIVSQHLAHNLAIHALHVDGVCILAGPVHCTAERVQAKIVGLLKRLRGAWGHHGRRLTQTHTHI